MLLIALGYAVRLEVDSGTRFQGWNMQGLLVWNPSRIPESLLTGLANGIDMLR